MTTKGLKPKDRKLATQSKGKLTANQWQSTPQQLRFMELWLEPTSNTFGNAYKSALEAGYSVRYAQIIATPTVNNKWISEFHRRLNFTEEHVRQSLIALIQKANDSRSPDDTRLKAIELYSKITGLIDNKGGTTVNIVQPILAGNSITPVKIVNDTTDAITALDDN